MEATEVISTNEAREQRPRRSMQVLMPMRERMAYLIAKGWSRADAYREAFGEPEMGAPEAAKHAYVELRAYKNELSKRRKLSRLNKENEQTKAAEEVARNAGKLMTKNELMIQCADLLRKAVRREETENARRLIETYARLAGYNAPDKVEVTHDPVTEFVKAQMGKGGAMDLVRGDAEGIGAGRDTSVEDTWGEERGVKDNPRVDGAKAVNIEWGLI